MHTVRRWWCELCDLGEGECEHRFVLYSTNYDDLRELIFHEVLWLNKNCNDVFKFANVFSKARKRRHDG